VEGHDQKNYSGAWCWIGAPLFRAGLVLPPTFNFLPVPLNTDSSSIAHLYVELNIKRHNQARNI